MAKKKIIYVLGVFLLFSIASTTLNAKAHPPSNMSLSYNSSTKVLSVTISHYVTDPLTHYVITVEIKVNGSTVKFETYSNQTSTSTFTYHYNNITANNGATIQVTATCSITGNFVRSLVVSEGLTSDGQPAISGYFGLVLITITTSITILPIIYKKIKKLN
ncbi:MAG: hypothetical protein ACFE9Q_09255 [Candidatus Hodarchaeota archaeon]